MSRLRKLLTGRIGATAMTALIAWALARHDHVETVGFDYGQRHVVEMEQRSVVREAIRARFPQWAGKNGLPLARRRRCCVRLLVWLSAV